MAQESNYIVEVSDNGTSGWAQLAELAAGTTSYQHTGLAASTTKHYRVKAKGNGTTTSDSAYSSVANATTQAAGVTYEAEATSLFNSMATAPDATRKGHINTYIKALKDNGIWTKLDRLFVFAAHTNAGGEALKDWKNPSRSATAINNPYFVQDEGFQSGSTTAYIKSGFAPLTNGVNFTLNSASFMFYKIANADAPMGAYGPASVATRCEVFNGVANISQNTTSAGPATYDAGFGLVQRTGSASAQAWENSTEFAVTAGTSTRLVAEELYILARNNNGTADKIIANNQVSMAAFGGSFTSAEVAAFRTATEAYMDALGKGVVA
jgi:hypothetical protein